MEAKNEIMSKQTIKPSSPTPHHLRDFKLSFLDRLSPHQYVPVLLFYSASDVTSFSSLSGKLKASLSDVLSLFYPLCGRTKGNACIECNDAGVLYIEARVHCNLTEILDHPQVHVLKGLFPIDPYKPESGCINNEEPVLMAVKVSKLSCGAIVLGVCISHKIADGTAVASFLNAWVATAKASDDNNTLKPHMEASLLFPARDNMNFSSPLIGRIDNKDIVVMRLVFDGASLSKLKADIGNGNFNFNPTRVEAVTAIIWKSMMEAAIGSTSGDEKLVGSFATHVVNIRGRMVPPLPENCIGNVVQLAVTDPLIELQVDKRVIELKDLAMMVRKSIMKFDADYVSKLVGDFGFDMVVESFEKVMPMNLKGVIWYDFISWTRFPLYEADFGWGQPTWVSTVGLPVRNNITLLPTRCGEGIEAWVNMNEEEMVEFQSNPQLLQYASLVSLASS